jgi:hypothetical protein
MGQHREPPMRGVTAGVYTIALGALIASILLCVMYLAYMPGGQ